MGPCPLLHRLVQRESTTKTFSVGEELSLIFILRVDVELGVVERTLVLLDRTTSLFDHSFSFRLGHSWGPFGFVLGRVVHYSLGGVSSV